MRDSEFERPGAEWVRPRHWMVRDQSGGCGADDDAGVSRPPTLRSLPTVLHLLDWPSRETAAILPTVPRLEQSL